MTTPDYRAALAAATFPNTSTDTSDERHDVPAMSERCKVGCEDWLRQMKFLCPGTKDDETWEKIKKNWIGFLAATCRIPPEKVATLAPNRKVVRWGSGEENTQERKNRFLQDRRRRMTIQAAFWNHLDNTERHTEKWPRDVRIVLNSVDKEAAGQPFKTVAPIWELAKRRRYQAIWTGLVAFLLHSNDEGTLSEMGLELDDEQIDDILDIEQEIWLVHPNDLRTNPDLLQVVWDRAQQLLTNAVVKEASTATNNPLLWWMCVLVRSAISGEVDFISSGRFNRNPLPMDLDMAGRVEAVVHYAKVLVLEQCFWTWDDQRLRQLVGLDIDKVSIEWINVEGGNRPKDTKDAICEKAAWQEMLKRLRKSTADFLGEKNGTALHSIRRLKEQLAA